MWSLPSEIKIKIVKFQYLEKISIVNLVSVTNGAREYNAECPTAVHVHVLLICFAREISALYYLMQAVFKVQSIILSNHMLNLNKIIYRSP